MYNNNYWNTSVNNQSVLQSTNNINNYFPSVIQNEIYDWQQWTSITTKIKKEEQSVKI